MKNIVFAGDTSDFYGEHFLGIYEDDRVTRVKNINDKNKIKIENIFNQYGSSDFMEYDILFLDDELFKKTFYVNYDTEAPDQKEEVRITFNKDANDDFVKNVTNVIKKDFDSKIPKKRVEVISIFSIYDFRETIESANEELKDYNLKLNEDFSIELLEEILPTTRSEKLTSIDIDEDEDEDELPF